MKVEIKCLNCEDSFLTDYKHRDKKFCDRKCYFTYAKKNNLLGREKDPEVREERVCLQCGGKFYERKKYERKICSNECRTLWNSSIENKNERLKKSKDSLLSKYGVDSFFKLNEFKKNKKNDFIKKYGVSHPMYVPEFVNKLKNTFRKNHLTNLIPKLNESNLKLISDYKANKLGNTSQSYNFKCEICDNIFSSTLLGSGKIPICRKCYPIQKNSKLEMIIKDFLNLHGVTHIDNCRNLLGGREIDIFLPDHNLGIEVNGNYYHSELSGDKNKNYHIDKTLDCEKKGIKLIQFYEDEIINKTDIVFSILLNKIKKNIDKRIYARNCEIKIIDKKNSSKFLNENHLQGNSVDKIRYGLFYKDEMVSVMTFGKKRKSLGNKSNDDSVYELTRFCNKINHSIAGGFTKLIHHFLKTYKPKKIETFADVRISGVNPEDTVYFKNNFNFVKKTPPNYWYINTERYLNRHHRFVFRKDVLVKEGYDKEMTEWEIMKLKGYDRIWDCGSLKFELVNQEKLN